MQRKNDNMINKFTYTVSLLILIVLSHKTFSQVLPIVKHSQQKHSSFKWNTNAKGNTEFSWKKGFLKNTLSNVDNSGVKISFELLGETNTLCSWSQNSRTTNSPEIGKSINRENNLQMYTSGFKTGEGITLQIDFSEPVTNAFFKLLNVNKYFRNGDKFIITGKTSANKIVYPKFTKVADASYITNKTKGVVDAVTYSVGSKASVNVAFLEVEKIKSIKIEWKDCSSCLEKYAHGFGMSGITFNKQFIDTDKDGIEDTIDIDDDNDGILDKIESSFKTISKNTAKGTPLFTYSKGIDYKENITDGINYRGAKFNSTKDELVVNFGRKIPAHTYINLRTFPQYYKRKALVVLQSNANGTVTSNPKYISHFGYYPKNTYYKLNSDTQFIKIKMVQNSGGALYVDYIEHQKFSILTDIDTDGDGIPNRLDLDSDNDGCSDAVESCVPDVFVDAETKLTSTTIREAIIDGEFGENGFSKNLEKTDYRNTEANFQNAYQYAIDKNINACGIPMITQVVKAPNNNWLEITNIHPTAIIPKNAVVISLFKNLTNNLTGVSPNATVRNPLEIKPGESLLFKNDAATIPLLSNLLFNNNSITNFSGSENTITVSRASNSLTWDSRIDVSTNIKDKTGYVRIDEVTAPNKEYLENEWVAFMNNNLNPYRDLSEGGPERHPHDPLLSEIVTAKPTSNAMLGFHKIKPTERINGVWSNGYPDRSRYVIVKEDYHEKDSILKARKLKVTNNSSLLLENGLLLVTDSIQLVNAEDEIRLAKKSELIQTHTNSKQFYGLGKLLVDKETRVASIYRYSYLSSPVNSNNKNTYTVSDVLKDGTTPLSINSNIVDVNFVSGFDGATTSPISIADYWIYTFSSNNGNRSNYEQKRSTGTIRQTSGFLIKGTGVRQNYTFVGTANDGKLTTRIGAEDSYLLGNPYPSSISAKKFIEDNINSINGTLYFWQHAGEQDIESSNIAGHTFSGYVGGYATRNIAMGISANLVASNNSTNLNNASVSTEEYRSPGNYIPVGTGFFVGGSKTGGEIVFNNSQREFNNNDTSIIQTEPNKTLLGNLLDILPIVTFKDPNKLPIIKLGLDYKNGEETIHRQIGVSFNKNNSFEKETGYDSELFDENDTDFYWKFSNDESKYSIVGVQEISSELEIPLEVVMNYTGNISIKIDEKRFVDAKTFLKDKLTNITYNLSETINLELEEGVYSDRFYLTFTANEANSSTSTFVEEEEEIKEPEFDLLFNNSTKIVKIKKNKEITIRRVSLFRIFGKRVQSWKIKNQEDVLNLKIKSRIRDEIYIVRVRTNKGVFNKKIYVE
jgi:hypothetical protein